MNEYEKLDALILERLNETHGMHFVTLQCSKKIDGELTALARDTGRETFRILDARLQALRKGGLIRHPDNRTGWLKTAPGERKE